MSRKKRVVRVMLSIHPDFLFVVDALAGKKFMSRSELMRLALRDLIEKEQELIL